MTKIKTELSRFKVKPEKIDKAKEWMSFLKTNLPLVLETLEGEKMFIETIFSELRNGKFFLYWYSVQGDVSVDLAKSPH